MQNRVTMKTGILLRPIILYILFEIVNWGTEHGEDRIQERIEAYRDVDGRKRGMNNEMDTRMERVTNRKECKMWANSSSV
jgi:hypothetical protein